MKNKAILFLIDQKFPKIPVRKSNKTKKYFRWNLLQDLREDYRKTFTPIANFYFRIRKKCGKSSQMFVMKMSVSRTWCLSEKKYE